MRKSHYLILILLCLAIAFFGLAYPMYVIRPFRHQGPRELAAALAVIQIRPIVTALVTLAALFTLVLYWRVQRRRLRRIAVTFAVLLVCACTALSRVNVYEMMFHPMGPPSSEPVQNTKLDGKEMVIAVNVGGAARAYPIRIISYHHVINDVLDGVPIVATY